MEGALKLKEVSYIHAEAYPAAELKHGPLALISPETPTDNGGAATTSFLVKNLSTVAEVRARQGPVLADHPPWRHPARRGGRVRGSSLGARTRSDPAQHPATTAGLPRGPWARSRHRPTTKPGQVCDRRVSRHRVRHSRASALYSWVRLRVFTSDSIAVLVGPLHRGERRLPRGRRTAPQIASASSASFFCRRR